MRAGVLALGVVVLLGAGCGASGSAGSVDRRSTDPAEAGKAQVVATFYPLAEAAERVGGDLVSVTNLTPAGVEPHDLELTTTQVNRLEDADVVLYLGDGFQPAIEKVIGRRRRPSVDILRSVTPLTRLTQDAGQRANGGGGVDPHFWLDPVKMIQAVERVETALAMAQPQNNQRFRDNAEAFKTQLSALDDQFSAGLAQCRRRDFVTSHDAFSYLAGRYQLTQRAIAGLSPESEPDPERLAELSDLIRRDGITTVFYEELVPARLAETLAREAHVRTAVLSPLEGLPRNDPGADYLSVMGQNLQALRQALECG